MKIAVAARPHPREHVSGDGWTHSRHEQLMRVALIDGLGHGEAAAEAAEAARAVLDARPHGDLREALERCDIALRGTRGAAVTLVLVDGAGRSLEFAGVGNVEARLWDGAAQRRLVPQRGIVGSAIPTIRPERRTFGEGWALMLYTDGISARFELDADRAHEAQEDGDGVAARILEIHGREQDDATVLIVTASLSSAVPPRHA